MAPIPITILTGFLGSGKTTIILNLIPQLPPSYKLALLKNEFGDVAIDSTLASSQSISGVRELLNGCICCNLVGQLSDALADLRRDVAPDRIVIETSGSAFPATLAMEVNRLARESMVDGEPAYVLDGVVSVIDVENWKGYDDTSYTAKMQAKYTDLIVYNKWEDAGERRLDECMDRVGDLDVVVASTRSEKGRVNAGLMLGLDSKLLQLQNGLDTKPEHEHDHQSEVEVLSISLPGQNGAVIDLPSLEAFLNAAPKDEVYRIKAILRTSSPPKSSDGSVASVCSSGTYILNWAFSRWTFTSVSDSGEDVLKMTVVLARGEAGRWQKKIQESRWLRIEGGQEQEVQIRRIS